MDGVSVTSAAESAGSNCANGGTKFTAANGVTYACNGQDGAGGGGASLDALEGTSCEDGAGTTHLTYSSDQTVSITCLTVSRMLTVALDVSGGVSGTVTSSPAGIDCPGTCSASFNDGMQVTLTATGSLFKSFVGWSGDCGNQGNTCVLTMSAAKNVTKFRPPAALRLTLSHTAAPSDFLITSSPAGVHCGITHIEPSPVSCFPVLFTDGTSVTLTSVDQPVTPFPVPPVWGGACAGATGSTCTLTLSGITDVTATYP